MSKIIFVTITYFTQLKIHTAHEKSGFIVVIQFIWIFIKICEYEFEMLWISMNMNLTFHESSMNWAWAIWIYDERSKLLWAVWLWIFLKIHTAHMNSMNWVFKSKNGQIDVYEGKVEGGCELKILSIVVSMVAVSLVPLLRI